MIAPFTSVVLLAAAALKGARTRSYAPFVTGLLWTWMWVLTWGNTGNPDLEGYQYLYQSNLTTEGIGAGYWAIVEVARGAGLSYTQFVAITSGFSFAIMSLVASWFTERTSLVAALYFIYPFVYDAIQTRNSLAMSLVVLGFALQARIPRRGTLVNFVLVLLASTLHVTMLVFLVGVLVSKDWGRRAAKVLAIVGSLLVPAAVFSPEILAPAIDFILGQMQVNRFETYFSTRGSLGIILFAGLHFASLFLLRLTLTSAHSEREDHVTASTMARHRLLVIVYYSALGLTILLPFVALNSNFFRLLRNMWFLYAIAFCIGVDSDRKDGKTRILVPAWLLALAHSIVFVLLDYTSVVEPILRNNDVIEFLLT